MGGLYFWVCKMKPDAPFLGCMSVILCSLVPPALKMPTRALLSSFAMVLCSLYGVGLCYRDGLHRYIRQLEVQNLANQLFSHSLILLF